MVARYDKLVYLFTQMFIYCDEVLPSIVGNTKSQLLARVSIQSEGQGSRTLCTYTPPDVPRQLIK